MTKTHKKRAGLYSEQRLEDVYCYPAGTPSAPLIPPMLAAVSSFSLSLHLPWCSGFTYLLCVTGDLCDFLCSTCFQSAENGGWRLLECLLCKSDRGVVWLGRGGVPPSHGDAGPPVVSCCWEAFVGFPRCSSCAAGGGSAAGHHAAARHETMPIKPPCSD